MDIALLIASPPSGGGQALKTAVPSPLLNSGSDFQACLLQACVQFSLATEQQGKVATTASDEEGGPEGLPVHGQPVKKHTAPDSSERNEVTKSANAASLPQGVWLAQTTMLTPLPMGTVVSEQSSAGPVAQANNEETQVTDGALQGDKPSFQPARKVMGLTPFGPWALPTQAAAGIPQDADAVRLHGAARLTSPSLPQRVVSVLAGESVAAKAPDSQTPLPSALLAQGEPAALQPALATQGMVFSHRPITTAGQDQSHKTLTPFPSLVAGREQRRVSEDATQPTAPEPPFVNGNITAAAKLPTPVQLPGVKIRGTPLFTDSSNTPMDIQGDSRLETTATESPQLSADKVAPISAAGQHVADLSTNTMLQDQPAALPLAASVIPDKPANPAATGALPSADEALALPVSSLPDSPAWSDRDNEGENNQPKGKDQHAEAPDAVLGTEHGAANNEPSFQGAVSAFVRNGANQSINQSPGNQTEAQAAHPQELPFLPPPPVHRIVAPIEHPTLGNLQLSLAMHLGRLDVSLLTASPMAAAQLESQAATLFRHLEDNALPVERIQVGTASRRRSVTSLVGRSGKHSTAEVRLEGANPSAFSFLA